MIEQYERDIEAIHRESVVKINKLEEQQQKNGGGFFFRGLWGSSSRNISNGTKQQTAQGSGGGGVVIGKHVYRLGAAALGAVFVVLLVLVVVVSRQGNELAQVVDTMHQGGLSSEVRFASPSPSV